jgi:hypothetical protein
MKLEFRGKNLEARLVANTCCRHLEGFIERQGFVEGSRRF